MSKHKLAALASASLFVLAPPAHAQVVGYFECDVEDVATFAGTINRFFEAMTGGPRPTISLDALIFNGENRASHRIVVNYESYEAYEAFRGRTAGSTAAMQLGNSIQLSADCLSEGIAVERRSWGNREAPFSYIAVYPASVSDSGAYVAALTDLMTSAIGRAAPGPVILYENRAGNQGVTHFVVFLSPTFAALNSYLDQLLSNDTYVDFVEEVRDIRELQTANQAQRIRTWEP